MTDIKEITKENFDTDVLQSQDLVLIYFYASWCKQCAKANDVLKKATNEVEGQALVVKVDTDQEAAIVSQQKVTTIPFFQILKDGKVIDSLRGVPSPLELMGMLSSAISEHSDAESPDESKETKA
ncbi:MAG: thioredoxin family protein [Candidatus Latescibacterota bacterium]|jgi:thioredoxin 1